MSQKRTGVEIAEEAAVRTARTKTQTAPEDLVDLASIHRGMSRSHTT
jgi:hypothetical protein